MFGIISDLIKLWDNLLQKNTFKNYYNRKVEFLQEILLSFRSEGVTGVSEPGQEKSTARALAVP